LREPMVPPRLRLYCLPYAGGSARAFQSWPYVLPPDIAVYGVEYPGHGRRMSEPTLDRIDHLADHLVGALAGTPPGPYALFGHSMGALAAFEMSHQLASRGAPSPVLLVLSGRGAASLPASERPVHASSDATFLTRLRKLNATPPEALERSDLLDMMMPILRADFRAAETYVPASRRKLDIPIVAYGGLRDPHVDRDRLLGWADETTARCAVRMFPGDHFFLRRVRNKVLATLARDLMQALAASERRATADVSQPAQL
jgi:surfactin synthase thioesterase subunit